MTEAWQTCRCGKEFYVRGLAGVPTLCRACASDMFVALNICPESMPIPGGSSSCRLAFRHAGRCEPHEDSPITLTSSGPPAHETTGAPDQ